MLCPRCGAPLVPGAAFCSRCGQAIAQAKPTGEVRPTTPPGVTPAAGIAAGAAAAGGAGLKKPLLIAGSALAIVLIGLLALKLTGILGKESSLPDPILQKPASVAPPMLAKTDTVAPTATMPEDVLNWLKHLQRIEDKKKEITNKQLVDMKVFQQMIGTLGAGVGELNPYDQTGDNGDSPQDVTKGKFQDLRPDWEALIQDYESVPPPAECQPIADAYFKGLNNIPGMVGDLNNVLNQVGSDPTAALTEAKKMANVSYDSIDKPMADADLKVQGICDKYHTPKWFNIGDVGQSMFSKF